MTFDDTYRTAWSFTDPAVEVGHVLREGSPASELPVRIPLRMMNRHGMIAGSTGTGKTRTLQLIAEQLSRVGVPSFLADVKGDLAGMSIAGEASERLTARAAAVGRTFTPEAFPVEFFSLTGNHGIQLRATVSSFGPILLGKVVDLTDVQQSVLAMVFKYCDDRRMPLLDFDDLREVLTYLTTDDAKNVKATASTFPVSEYVDVAKSLTTLGIGEALVTALDPKGVPTPVANAQILAPSSSMSAIDDAQYQRVIAASPLAPKYSTPINRESAHEMLQRKLEESAEAEDDFERRRNGSGAAGFSPPKIRRRRAKARRSTSVVEDVLGSTVAREVVRGLFGMLRGR